jgi:MoxR-like ATPase
VPLIFVEGNADLTTGRLVGHHDPAASLQQGFTEQTFVEGPLVRAMRLGGFLYIEEVNRAPEETLNALLTAIAEREISIPRAGTVRAKSGFRVVASMNPFDNIGTSRISTSVYDRLCRVAIDYQATEDEISIVSARTGSSDARLVADSVALTRITRSHPQIRQGSSVRGAIDLVLVAAQLLQLTSENSSYRDVILDAMHVALSGRVRVHETTTATAESILTSIWEQYFLDRPEQMSPG